MPYTQPHQGLNVWCVHSILESLAIFFTFSANTVFCPINPEKWCEAIGFDSKLEDGSLFVIVVKRAAAKPSTFSNAVVTPTGIVGKG